MRAAMEQLPLWESPGWRSPFDVRTVLAANHYLGPTARGVAWRDAHGVLVLAPPTSRHLPTRWLELTRWCLSGVPNAGSQQWAAVAAAMRTKFPDVTTVVSYSDPAAGHTGALYRACNWLWAPTWTRLRPPPSGNGSWVDGEAQSVKDRWVYPLAADSERASILAVKDEAILRRFPWASYREPRTRRGQPVPGTGGGDWRRFATEHTASEAA